MKTGYPNLVSLHFRGACVVAGIVCLAVLTAAWPARGTQAAPLDRPVSFLNDVEPILTRSGCNSGPCHGSQFGKGGFKLSLAAYDPDLDYQSMAKLAGGRRINLVEPEKSLLIGKPALQVVHKGGLRLTPGSADHRTLVRWIRQGAPGPNPNDPRVIGLAVEPTKRVLSVGQSVRLRVTAHYSDGARRNVTAHTRINSLNDVVAIATPDGVVKAAGNGATAVMLRYDGMAVVSQILVPYAKAGSTGTGSRRVRESGEGAGSFVDRLVAARWNELGLKPSDKCTDYEFIRRASLDVIGTLPTAEEIRTFTADRDPNKRANLIDRLLARPEYADYWAVKWSDLLRSSRAALGAKPAMALSTWIRSALARNERYDAIARDLLTAQGSASSVAPANYFRVATSPNELTETTAQLFLGVRMQCARCHHHPFEKWSQDDYYRLAAFFTGVEQRKSEEGNPLVVLQSTGELSHPKTGAVLKPSPLGMDGTPPFAGTGADRRESLAGWMTSPDNLAFARTLVNRYWSYFLGRGIVDPVDDIRVTNPPTNPELLDALARDFIQSGYDIRHLIRTICGSRAYQLSSMPTDRNRADRMFHSYFLPRRQSAEVLLDSIGQATGVAEKFEGMPAGTRATQLPDPGIASTFLDTFGRPPRSSTCECERVAEPSLPQSLLMLNGADLNRKVSASTGRAARLAASEITDNGIVDELYLSTLSRPPAEDERRTALSGFRRYSRRQATEDLLWALLNTKEFAYIR